MKNKTRLIKYTIGFIASIVLFVHFSCNDEIHPPNNKHIIFEANDSLKNVVLNVKIGPPNQLFHIEPIIKDSTRNIVGIVAIVGIIEKMSENGISQINFKILSEEDSVYPLYIIECRPKDLSGNSTNEIPVIIVNTTTKSNRGDKEFNMVCKPPMKRNQIYDIEFQIEGQRTTPSKTSGVPYSTPRICKFIIT